MFFINISIFYILWLQKTTFSYTRQRSLLAIFVVEAYRKRLEFPKMDEQSIKRNLEKKRIELDLTQTEMADRLGISLTAYRKLVKGKTRILNGNVEKFAHETGVSVAELVNGFEPISSVEAGLNSVKETYGGRIRLMEDGYNQELSVLRKEIERLKENLVNKEETIRTQKMLIEQLQKNLKSKY